MVAGKSGCGEFRSAGAGRVVRSLSRLAAIAAALTLVACTQSVMVNPANQDEPAPPPRPQSSSSRAPTHEVQAGDTLYKISMQYGVDYRELAAWNNIAAPYTIYPRQRLRVGAEPANDSAIASEGPAAATVPVAVAPAAAAASATAVASATTPAAASSSTTPASAAGATHAEGYDPELGVTLPAGAVPIASSTAPGSTSAPVFEPATPTASSVTGSQPVSASAPMPAAEAPLPEVSPSAASAAPTAAASPAAAPVTPTVGGADVANAKPSAAGWIWPTPGKVVVTYASGDPTRQGIDIAGDFGQPVRAARDGEVVYSGAGLIGYGELVIIKHSPELLSAYGHNRVRLVKEGDKIKAGQKIAEMGKNAANRVLLHFEVRKGGKPVDPMPLLPAK